MSKYTALSHALQGRKEASWRVSFSEIERCLDFRLPASARKYPAWWSNDPQSHSQTRAWVSIGWKTAQIDIPGEKVTFIKQHAGQTLKSSFARVEEPRILVLRDLPQWLFESIKERAHENAVSVEDAASEVLELGLRRHAHERLDKARRIRALAQGTVEVDLEELIRHGRAEH